MKPKLLVTLVTIVVLMGTLLLLLPACASGTPASQASQAPPTTSQASQAPPATSQASQAPPATSQSNQGPIILGISTTLTGDSAFIGGNEAKGAQVYIDYINSQGGINGRQVKLIMLDDGNVPNTIISNETELIEQDHIVAALAPESSPGEQAADTVFLKYKIPSILTSSLTQSVLNPNDPYAFRVTTNNHLEGQAQANIAIKGGFKRPAIVYINNTFGTDMNTVVTDALTKAGMPPVVSVSHDLGQADMGPVALKVKSANADVVLLENYLADSGNTVRALQHIGYNGSFNGYAGLQAYTFPELVGDLSNGVQFTGEETYYWAMPGADQALIRLDEALGLGKITNYNAPITYENPLNGYSAAELLCDAIKDAGSTNPDAIANALETHTYWTPNNYMSFTATNREGFTNIDQVWTEYWDKGHQMVYQGDPKSLPLFDQLREQAEEATYTSYTKGVTIKAFYQKWQSLLKSNQDTLMSQIDAKEKAGTFTSALAKQYRDVINEIIGSTY